MARPVLTRSGIFVPPPLLFALGLFPGLYLHRLWPVSLVVTELSVLRMALTWVFVVLGFVLLLWAFWSFIAAGAPVYATRSDAKLLTEGPYRFSRNPMYVAFTLLYVGIAVHRNTLWPLLFLPVVLWLVQRMVIRGEERFLVDTFGDRYRNYRQKVRRWL